MSERDEERDTLPDLPIASPTDGSVLANKIDDLQATLLETNTRLIELMSEMRAFRLSERTIVARLVTHEERFDTIERRLRALEAQAAE